jgi:hypothetical protein
MQDEAEQIEIPCGYCLEKIATDRFGTVRNASLESRFRRSERDLWSIENDASQSRIVLVVQQRAVRAADIDRE